VRLYRGQRRTPPPRSAECDVLRANVEFGGPPTPLNAAVQRAGTPSGPERGATHRPSPAGHPATSSSTPSNAPEGGCGAGGAAGRSSCCPCYDHDPGSNVVDVYVGYLRRKLGKERIVTVRGMGYALQD
jgi:hypothetical protein